MTDCIGSPLIPDVNYGMLSNWDNTTRLEGTAVSFTCIDGLQTRFGDTVQNQTCTVNGWVGWVGEAQCPWETRSVVKP